MNQTELLISSYLSSQYYFKTQTKNILSTVHGIDPGNSYLTYGNTIRGLSGNKILNTDAKQSLLKIFASETELSSVTDLSISNMEKFLYWFCQGKSENKDTYMTSLSAIWIDGELQQ